MLMITLLLLETLGMKYGMVQRKYEGEQQRLQIIWYHRFKFQDCYWLKLIVFFISQFYVWKDQIVSQIASEPIENNNYDFFCKVTLQYFQSTRESYMLRGRFESSCFCNIYQHSVIVTVGTENAMINARSRKVCL